jgi:hypothetical protein
VCGTYGSDIDISSGSYFAKVNQIETDNSIYANYDNETCMISKAISNNPELDDVNFEDYFSQYFDRSNSNIDEQFLYITGR